MAHADSGGKPSLDATAGILIKKQVSAKEAYES